MKDAVPFTEQEVSMFIEQAVANNFLDHKTVASFAGSSTAILAVTVTIRRLTGINNLFLPFILSMIVSFALSKADLHELLDYVLMVINGCVLFLAVVGANEGASGRPTARGKQQGSQPKKFLDSFFS
jgi:hypothetical protein